MRTDTTKINGTALSAFGASLISYNTGALSLKNNFFKADKRLKPTIFPVDMPLREVIIKCEFYAKTDALAEANETELCRRLSGAVDLYLPDGFYYTGTLTKISKPTRIAEGIFTREFTITAYRHGVLETLILSNGSNTVNIKGNYKTAVRYRITPSGSELTVDGITVTGITGNMVVIDGINCTVTDGGVNCFERTTATEFPTLNAGTNTIVISGSATTTVEYYPIYF